MFASRFWMLLHGFGWLLLKKVLKSIYLARATKNIYFWYLDANITKRPWTPVDSPRTSVDFHKRHTTPPHPPKKKHMHPRMNIPPCMGYGSSVRSLHWPYYSTREMWLIQVGHFAYPIFLHFPYLLQYLASSSVLNFLYLESRTFNTLGATSSQRS